MTGDVDRHEGFADRPKNCAIGIEAQEGVLKNVLKFPFSAKPLLVEAFRGYRLAIQQNRAAARFNGSNDRSGQGGFARSGFADNANDLACRDVQGNVVDDSFAVPAATKADSYVIDLESWSRKYGAMH